MKWFRHIVISAHIKPFYNRFLIIARGNKYNRCIAVMSYSFTNVKPITIRKLHIKQIHIIYIRMLIKFFNTSRRYNVIIL
mgnify:CR=1 FL=1